MKKKVKVSSISTTEKSFGKYVLLGIVVLLIFISYQIIAPYLIVLISAFVFAYLCKPVFNFLNQKLGKNISAIICLILVLAAIIVPAYFAISALASQASDTIKNEDIVAMVEKIATLPILDKINVNWANAVDRVGLFIFSIVGTVATRLPSILLSGLVFLFSFFYILVGWDSLTKRLKNFIPFKDKERIVQKIDYSTHGIIFGYLLIAILDFVIAAIGLRIAGVDFYLLLSFIIAIFVFIPGLGPSLVCVPLLAYYSLVSNWYSFIIVLIVWAIVALFLETFLTSKVLAGRAKISPVIMLVGILGGTSLFGLFGFIIGPLVLVYTIKLLEELMN